MKKNNVPKNFVLKVVVTMLILLLIIFFQIPSEAQYKKKHEAVKQHEKLQKEMSYENWIKTRIKRHRELVKQRKKYDRISRKEQIADRRYQKYKSKNN